MRVIKDYFETMEYSPADEVAAEDDRKNWEIYVLRNRGLELDPAVVDQCVAVHC